ncbi:SART-1 family protein DOT2 [Argentina anserina]|uniref:SART-1 family protein DOT2 n=1 Tax=Argentina anserina TaxID=57926 RepID=UPI0021767C74|nr:SART-1 family protein DOT2 [Potentilla anserina]XP_050372475.1 SART-1 family protein DOT2 [Potentilla anserina]
MDVERYEQREERYDRDDSPVSDDLEENGSRHRSKDRKKSSRGEEKDGRSKDRDRLRRSGGDDVAKDREKESKDRRKDDGDERYKDRSRDSKVREREYDRDRKDRGKEREVEKDGEKGRDKERAKEKTKDRERDRGKEKEREKQKDREKGKESVRDTDREKGKDKHREKEREADQDKEMSRGRQSKRSVNAYESNKIGEIDDSTKLSDDDNMDKISHNASYEQNSEPLSGGAHLSASELEERILKTKEERLKKKTEDIPEVLAWVNRSRKLEEKRNAEKEKALQLSKIFEEQDNVGEESDDENANHVMAHNLDGVKVLHGIDKVIEGGAVVLTLKDQNILADGDINEDVDMLENVELGEQKQRDDAYKAAKKKTGIYADKFNDDPTLEKKMLPQYDDPAVDEGLTLDARGRLTGEAEKKLEELRMRLQGGSLKIRSEDLNMSGKITSDYYTNEEMLQLKKTKKKKTFRKKEKLDLDALEAEAVSAGLGAADRGSRKDGRRQATREEQERLEVEKRNSAFQLAKDKANEASRALRQDILSVKAEEDDTPYFADDYDEIDKALERSRKIALKKKQEEMVSGPTAIARVAAAAASSTTDDQFSSIGQSQENKVVFTEMEEFVLGLQLDEESHNPESEDVFMQEDDEPKASVEVEMGEPSGWSEVNEIEENKAQSTIDDKEEIVPDETIHEVAVGKGLSGVLKLLKERGNLKEGIEWGGRNMDKKKSKLLGIVDDDEEPMTHMRRRKDEQKDTRSSGHQKEMRPPKDYQEKDIHIERTDEFGRTMTPKEAFRVLSHKFHGKGPGKMKQEKRMKQYQEELKLKQMKSSDTPSFSVERMIEAQAQSQTPYIVLSGHVKPGQTSDPRSGFATVEKDLPGGLTPMLGDRKVEHFLGIKRKDDSASSGTPKKPKT